MKRPNEEWVRLAYDLWATLDTDDLPTLENVAWIAEEVRAEFGVTTRHLPDHRVLRWLAEEQTFSPHIDRIAVERALLFDWDVIDNLTDHERSLFIDRLCAMDDPLGLEAKERALLGHQRGLTHGQTMWRPSRRHTQWMRGSKAQRDRVMKTASRRGVRLAEVAA